jgi:pilus assembly protein CpaB
MSRRRRAALLAGLALVLGGLAASDVARREAALREQLAPLVDVVVARRALDAGHRIRAHDLGVRRVPARFAPPGAPAVAEVLVGERAAEVVAAAPPGTVGPGARVDVLVTRDRGAGAGSTTLALEDVEVLAARPAPAPPDGGGTPRVAATLRVTPRQAVYLAAAGAFAREVRLLARAAGDRRRAGPIVSR